MFSLLYIDDEADLLTLGKLLLEKGGEFSVATEDSARNGLQKLAECRFDAVISDYQMPGMDGIGMLKEVRSQYGSLPFLLFTGRGREEVVIEAINNGADFYVQKGGDPRSQFAELRHKILIAIERRRAVDALRIENEKNRGLMDHANDAIFIADAESGMLIDANTKAQAMLGRSLEEIRAMHHSEMHPKDEIDLYKEYFADHARHGTGVQAEVVVDREGNAIPVIVSSTAIDLGGKRCLMGIFHDISEIQRAQDALKIANKKLNLLAEITRHDIRNKLTVVGGYLELIRDRPSEPEYSMYLKKIVDTVHTIGHNIEFTRLYENLGTTAPGWQNVHEVFFRACTHLDIKRICVQSDADGLDIFADPLLERAFYNLAENAIQHGGDISVIRISAQEEGDGVTIRIEDNGVGIPSFDKEKIFSKGFGKNTGLGLFLVQEILIITGISIRETGEYHHGARFELHVPRGGYRFNPEKSDRCHLALRGFSQEKVRGN
jgi:PAS domain S-box-containing protein